MPRADPIRRITLRRGIYKANYSFETTVSGKCREVRSLEIQRGVRRATRQPAKPDLLVVRFYAAGKGKSRVRGHCCPNHSRDILITPVFDGGCSPPLCAFVCSPVTAEYKAVDPRVAAASPVPRKSRLLIVLLSQQNLLICSPLFEFRDTLCANQLLQT